MVNFNVFFGVFLLWLTPTYAQYCISGGPTSNSDSNVESVVFIGSSGTINHIGCPSQIGVEQYLNESVTLSAGGSFNLQIDYGTCGGNYASAGSVWIDFDQSQSFTQNELVGTWTGTPPTAPVNYTVLVPFNAHNGTTRMRVIQQEGGILPLNPCGSFQWGSVMDFGIQVIDGLDCSAVLGDDLANAIEISSLPFTDTGDLSYCYGNQNLVYDSPDIYYKLLLNPTLTSIGVSSCGSNFDSFLSVLTPSGEVLAYNDDNAACSPQSALIFDVNDLGYVYIILEGWGNESGNFEINVFGQYAEMGEQVLDLSTYPNPTSTLLNIPFEAEFTNCYNLSGQFVNTFIVSQHQIDVRDLAPGSYVLIYQKDQKMVRAPFFKY